MGVSLSNLLANVPALLGNDSTFAEPTSKSLWTPAVDHLWTPSGAPSFRGLLDPPTWGALRRRGPTTPKAPPLGDAAGLHPQAGHLLFVGGHRSSRSSTGAP